MKKTVLRLFVRSAAVFLAFWLLMAGVLSYSNLARMRESVGYANEEVRQRAAYDTQDILAGGAAWEEKGHIAAWRLTFNQLGDYGGAMLTRVYRSGTEMARSQMAMGAIALSGTGTYDHFILFDPVLTDEEQIALAYLLKGDPRLDAFHGGEKYPVNGALYGEVTGIREGNAIYPQRLVFYFEDGPIAAVESHSDLFQGEKLVTLRFDSAMLISCLTNGTYPNRSRLPERILKQYRRAERALDELLEHSEISESSGAAMVSSDVRAEGGAVARTDVIVCSAYACRSFDLATYGMGPTYVLTLIAALLLALAVARIQEQMLRRQQDFTSAAAHELKTPLAVLRAHAESLREDIAPEKREAYLDIVLDEADRMDALVRELLDLSRLEVGARGRPDTPVELSDAVRACADRLSLPAEERGLRLTLDLAPGTVAGDRTELERLADNLLSNALRHCRPGGAIGVRLERRGDDLRLTVENDGDPIPAEDLPRIWDPFYKGDRARGRDSGGAGLGLALVRQIAASHGGRCAAENLEGAVRFTVTLPALHSIC